jgi:ribulose-5-phosphate 4-epimerase/fuculose-1-phosphate aldolase
VTPRRRGKLRGGAKETDMSAVTPLRSKTLPDERQMRVDLAAVFRIAARMNWHEAIANHFSLALSSDGKRFLMNPRWMHFSRIRASDLLLIDADDPATMQRPDAPDITAWCIHGAMHARLPQARCVLHLHPPYATAVATLTDPQIKPIDQNTARFYNRVAYDLGYEGMATSLEEGRRLAGLLGDKSVMVLGNHGILVAGPSVAEAFDTLYYLERACQTLVLAYSTGQSINVMSDKAAEQTARDWEGFTDSSYVHFDEMKRILDATEPSYVE